MNESQRIALEIVDRLKPIISEDVLTQLHELIPNYEAKATFNKHDNKGSIDRAKIVFGEKPFFTMTVRFFQSDSPGFIEFRIVSSWETNQKEFTLFIDPTDLSPYLSEMMDLANQLVLHTAGIFIKDIPLIPVEDG